MAVLLVACSYGKVPIGSQSDLPDYTIIAKKSVCNSFASQSCAGSSYRIKLVLNGTVQEFWYREIDRYRYDPAQDGEILQSSCRELLRPVETLGRKD